MRLHRLTLTAFGPFGGTQHVDFDELSAAGIFLLHGATGAGKTSVLDAVCYALYGGVPGARQQPGGTLRSQHADAHTSTRVVLELTVGGRRLEITRLPEQPRPKKTGGGTTRDRAQAELREYDAATGEWRGLSRSHQEIGEEIGQLLGMSRDQFCQVVLLPQGDFARFLRAGAEERAKLLGRLFDTGRFAAAEEVLARMRRSAHEEVRSADEALLALAHRMEQAAGETRPKDLPLPGAGVPDQRSAERAVPEATGSVAEAVLEWAAHARTNAREHRDIAALAARSAEAAHESAAHRLEAEAELARLQERHAAALARRAELRARSAERSATRTRLERARGADAVVPALGLRDTAGAEHRAAGKLARAARDALPADLTGRPDGEVAEAERTTRRELGALAAARRSEERGAHLTAELDRIERESRYDDELLAEAGQWLAGWEKLHREHRERVRATGDAAVRAERLAGVLATAERALAAARRRRELDARAATAEEELLRARERSLGAHEHWLGLKDRRLRGIAAELAAGLSDGEACPVCGAAEHPRPAPAGPGHVDRQAEEEALEGYRRSESERESAEQRLRSLREAREAAAAEAGDRTGGELGAEVTRLTAEHAEARTEAAGAHAAREALAAAEREHADRQDARQRAERRSAARTSQREALLDERSALTEELERARGSAVSVAARAAELERRAECLERAVETARTAEASARRLAEAEEALDGAARTAGFGSPREAAEAVLDQATQRTLQHRLDAWQAEEAAVEADLADPGLVAASRRPPADPAAARSAAEAATHRLRETSAADAAAGERCAQLDDLGSRAAADVRRMDPLRRRYRSAAALAGLAAGTSADNERRMRLETYVLAARLEQIAAAASARLAHMSAGRYTLLHSDERLSGRGRSGLGLRVIDSWTGLERDTSTLSGGETFFASLALALGLADVVTDEAGGTRLETLFIDEGFGSLDEQTLDEVLDVLDSLRERDRSVGIVSHVPDLRRRIPAQLEVVKARAGSSLRHRAPDGG